MAEGWRKDRIHVIRRKCEFHSLSTVSPGLGLNRECFRSESSDLSGIWVISTDLSGIRVISANLSGFCL